LAAEFAADRPNSVGTPRSCHTLAAGSAAMTTADRIIERLAAKQCGAVSLAQLVPRGVTEEMVRRRRENGALLATRFAAVYRLPSHPDSWRQRLWGAWLWAPPGSLVGGRAAAPLYGLDRCPEGPIELLLPPNAKHAAPRGVTVRRSDAGSVPREIEGLPVTDPETTLLGVARAVRIEVLDDVLESAFDDGLTTPEKLLLAIGRRAGSGPIRRILEGRAPGRPRQKRLEGEFVRLMFRAGIDVDRQVEVRVSGDRFFFDFTIRGRRVAVEVDGFGKLRTKAGKQKFLERSTKLALIGWTILHFSWEDVMHRPDYVVATVLAALGAHAQIG
jgi:very-short-patch-repair endonuclease